MKIKMNKKTHLMIVVVKKSLKVLLKKTKMKRSVKMNKNRIKSKIKKVFKIMKV